MISIPFLFYTSHVDKKFTYTYNIASKANQQVIFKKINKKF